jgi:hypothetical protein
MKGAGSDKQFYQTGLGGWIVGGGEGVKVGVVASRGGLAPSYYTGLRGVIVAREGEQASSERRQPEFLLVASEYTTTHTH